MRASSSPLFLLLMACGPPDIADSQNDGNGPRMSSSGPDESADKSWAGAGAFEFVFSEYLEEQGFTDCDVHYTLRWIEDDGVPCDGCAAAGVVAVNVVEDGCPWQDWADTLEPEHHRYAVYPDSEEVLFYNGETLTDMRDIGWEVQWAADSVHLVGTSTDHTYYAMESRTLIWQP